MIWDVLDVISISAYSILIPDGQTFGPSPDLHTTIALWEQQARDMNKWRIKAGYSKQQILIGEVGAQSKGGGIVYRKPFDWSTPAPPDQDEQAKMYEGILKAFMPKPWCMGVLLWHWELDPNPFPWSGYTPQGKLAEEVMTNYFNKTYSIEEAPKLH